MNDESEGTGSPTNSFGEAPDMSPVAKSFEALRQTVCREVVGQEDVLRLVYITLLISGHSLLEGVPGVAKTMLVRILAQAVSVRFGRVQFTPDLMPSDVIGTPIFRPQTGEVEFRPGPLFTDLLLADEINRASAKTQASLLEAMQERTATVDGRVYSLGGYFTVFATQNPVEQEGTYPLPEAELDRFLFKILVDYPSQEDEKVLLTRHHAAAMALPKINAVLNPDQIDQLRELVRQVVVSDDVMTYVTNLVRATRKDSNLVLGGSPRAGLLLLRAAKANAAIEGRDFVLPEDVQEMFYPALRHRILLDPAAEVEGLTPDEALERVLRGVTVPR